MQNKKGFSLIELLVVISIIGIIAAVMMVSIGSVRGKARDVRRKAELGQIARFMMSSVCFLPNAGPGDYDLAQLIEEVKLKYPQVSQILTIPFDPRSGSQTQTNYRYVVSDDAHCVLYANLENENDPITLPSISTPTAGGGTGVLESTINGVNGTKRFYQIGK